MRQTNREVIPDFVKDIDTQELEKLQREITEFRTFYDQNQTYLPLAVVRAFESLLTEISRTVWIAGLSVDEDALRGAAQAFGGKITEARKALETEFRKLLGVENDERQAPCVAPL